MHERYERDVCGGQDEAPFNRASFTADSRVASTAPGDAVAQDLDGDVAGRVHREDAMDEGVPPGQQQPIEERARDAWGRVG